MRTTVLALGLVTLAATSVIAAPVVTNSVVLCVSQQSCETLESSPNPIDSVWTRGTGQDQITVEGMATAEIMGNSFGVRARSKYTTAGVTDDWSQINAASQIRFNMTVEGTGVASIAPVFDITGVTGRAALANMVMFYNDGLHGLQTDSEWFEDSKVVTLGPLPVQRGIPVLMTFAFSATTFPGAAQGPQAITTDEADYSHTVLLRGIQIYDEAGRQLGAGVLSADSLNIAVIVPEPGYASELAVTLAALAAVRRRMRR